MGKDLVGVVKETMQPAHVSLWLRPETASKGHERDSWKRVVAKMVGPRRP